MRKHRVVIIVAISLLIGLIAYLCATLDYFSIKKITVKNNKIVKISEIKDYANYSLGENILDLIRKNYRKRLIKIFILEMQISRRFIQILLK